MLDKILCKYIICKHILYFKIIAQMYSMIIDQYNIITVPAVILSKRNSENEHETLMPT